MITLKTLHKATAQEVFDQVAKHLLTQNKKSTNGPTGGCVYHNAEGLKCAAGCLVDQNEYCAKMEGGPWDTLVHRGAVPTRHCSLIYALQRVHDSYESEQWKRKLLAVAKDYNLNTNTLNDN